MIDRCDLTDLLVDQCACPTHRGGQVIPAEPVQTVGQPFLASYEGRCSGCGQQIHVGDQIARAADPDDGYVHTRGGCAR